MALYGTGSYGGGVYANPFALNPTEASRGGGALFRVLLGTEDVTPYLDQFSYSNADPGGFEACTLSFPRGVRAPRGRAIRIELGTETVWMGRVAEGQPVFSTTVQGEGIGARLKDGRMVELYRHIDLTAWHGPSATRRLDLVDNDFANNEQAVEHDTSTGEPALRTAARGAWTATTQPDSSAWFDSSGVPLDSLYHPWTKGATVDTASAWEWAAVLSDSDAHLNSADSTGNLEAAGPGTGTLTASTDTRVFAAVYLRFNGAGGIDGGEFPVAWQPVLYGHHARGLDLRGTEPDAGFWPSDIVRDVLRRVSGIREGVIETASGLVVPHSAYLEPVPHETPIADMARLVGWHWGVWEPESILDSTPRLDFRSIPTAPTCFCTEADMDGDPDLSERLSDLYDTVQVAWTDGAGARHVTERTATVDELVEADLAGRVLDVDIGLSSQAAAETYGDFMLALQRSQARASGQVSLPGGVGTPAGVKPAALLKAGRDRLAVTDLPASGPLLDGTGRVAFHVRKVGVSVGSEGVRTTVDLDSGANLVDALAAQFQLSTSVAA